MSRTSAESAYVVQIQPRKLVLDRAEHVGPTQQQELDHTDYTKIENRSALEGVNGEAGNVDLSEVCILPLQSSFEPVLRHRTSFFGDELM